MDLFKFEWLKWSRNRKNLGIVLFVFILCFFSLFEVKKSEEKNKKDYFENIELNYQDLSGVIIQLSEQLDENPMDKEIEVKLSLYSDAMNELNEEHINLTENNWKKSLKNRVSYLRNIEQLINLGENIQLNDIPKNIPNDILHNEVLLKNNIEPFPITGSTRGVYFTKSLLDMFTTIFGILIIIFLFFDFFASEFEKKSCLLLFVQPFKRSRFFETKIKVAMLTTISLSVLFLLLFTLFGSQLSLSLGSINYPIAVNGSNIQSFSSLKLYNYFGIQFLFWLLLIMLTLLLIYLLSLVLKNSIEVLMISISLMVVPYFFVDALFDKYSIFKLTPFYYFSISEKIIDSYTEMNLVQFILIGIATISFHCFILLILLINSKKKMI